MARPNTVTPEVAARISALQEPGLTPAMLHRKVKAAGIDVSLRTLYRHMARQEMQEPPSLSVGLAAPTAPGAAEADTSNRFTPEAMIADLQKRYLEACRISDALQARAAIGGPEAKKWADFVRLIGDLALRLSELAPTPPLDPENDPGLLAAKDKLIAEVDAIIARGGV